MLIFIIFISLTLAANENLFTLSDGSLPNDSVLDSHVEKLDTDFMKEPSSLGSHLDSAAFFDDPENPFFEQADSDSDDHGSDSNSRYFAETGNFKYDCASSKEGLQPSRKKPRAEKFCPIDQNLKNSQQDAAGGSSDEGNTGSENPGDDDSSPLHLPADIPLVDFNSIDRNIGYCPEFFYGLLAIPVCASADPASIKKISLVYYNLDHAMRGTIISYLEF